MRLLIALSLLSGCFDFQALRDRDLGVGDLGTAVDFAEADFAGTDFGGFDLAGADLALGAGWKTINSPTTEHLWGVWGIGGHVWAVGSAATILHSSGGSFSAQPAPAAGGRELRAVWGTDPQHVWVAGENGIVLRTDDGGASWVSDGHALSSLRVHHMWGTSGTNIFAVGESGGVTNGEILHRAIGWQTVWGPRAYPLQAVWGLPSGDLYASGGTELIKKNGALWDSQIKGGLPTSGNNYWGLWGSATDRLFIASDNPYRWDGVTWTKGTLMPPPAGFRDFYGVFGFSSGDTYVVGQECLIYHSVGTDLWTLEPRADAITSGDLEAVWGPHPGEVWAVGAPGLILRR